jgi:hypothetical protein
MVLLHGGPVPPPSPPAPATSDHTTAIGCPAYTTSRRRRLMAVVPAKIAH